jgi:hypothetical protein
MHGSQTISTFSLFILLTKEAINFGEIFCKPLVVPLCEGDQLLFVDECVRPVHANAN